MINTVSFLEPARIELIKAVKYYNMQSDGLGFEFASEIKKTIGKICAFPKSWAKISDNLRKSKCYRFPYNVIYYPQDETIIIVAIMHMKRKPEYWEMRTTPD